MSALHCVYHRLPIVYIRLKTTLLSLPGLPCGANTATPVLETCCHAATEELCTFNRHVTQFESY